LRHYFPGDAQNQRLIEVRGDFVALCPYAPRAHTKLDHPRTHEAAFERFGLGRPGSAVDLGTLLRRTLQRIRTITSEFHLAAPHRAQYPASLRESGLLRTIDDDYHWHIEILPLVAGKSKSYSFKEAYYSPVTSETASSACARQRSRGKTRKAEDRMPDNEHQSLPPNSYNGRLPEASVETFDCPLLLLAAACAQTAPNTVAMKQQMLWQKLESSVGDVDRNLDGVLGVAILDLSSGDRFLLHADQVFRKPVPSRSPYYGVVSPGANRKTETHRPVHHAVQRPGGRQRHHGGLTPGITQITLRDLATMMLAVSDNSATNVLIDRVGMENVNALMESLGLAHTRLRRKMMDLKAAGEGRENISTPAEMMALLEALYRGKVLNPEMTTDFFQMLSTHKASFILATCPRIKDRQQAG